MINNTLSLANVHLWLPDFIFHMEETLKKHAQGKRCFNLAVIKLYLHLQYELGFSGMYLSPRKVSLEFQKLIKKKLVGGLVSKNTSYFHIDVQDVL